MAGTDFSGFAATNRVSMAETLDWFDRYLADHPEVELVYRRHPSEWNSPALEELAKAVEGPWTPGKFLLYRHARFKESGNAWLQRMPEVLRTSIWSDKHYAFLRDDPHCAARLRELFGAADEQA